MLKGKASVRRSVAWAAALALAFALWAGLCLSVQALPVSAVELRFAQDVVEDSAVKDALARAVEPVRTAAWSTEEAVEVRGLKAANARVARYSGDARLLVDAEPLYGHLLGVSVSAQLAQALWGSVEVVGLEILIDGVAHSVCGVYRFGKADVLMPEADNARFHHLSLAFPASPEADWHARARELTDALGVGDASVLDTPLHAALLRFIARLPGWVLIIGMMCHALRAALLRPRPRYWPVLLGMGVAGCIGALWAYRPEFTIPRSFLPTRWSDFTGWRTTFSAAGGRLSEFLHGEYTPLKGRFTGLAGQISAMSGMQSALVLLLLSRLSRGIGGRFK